MKKVVIIGGSHSAFSCAWILLNQPSMCGRVDSVLFAGKVNHSCNTCTREFCCYGRVISRNWSYSGKVDGIEIEILYQDLIKVYYQSEKEALNDGYNKYDPKKAVNKNGNVYPFIGLRADAKDLYRSTVSGKEKRVKLIRCDSFEKQKSHINDSTIVIWACGYTTELINITDKCDRAFELHVDHNKQIEVTRDLNLMDKNETIIRNLFGIGQGFSTHSIEVLNNGKNARADSVSLYNNYISKKLYKSLEQLGLFNKAKENYKSKAITRLEYKTQDRSKSTLKTNLYQMNFKSVSKHINTNMIYNTSKSIERVRPNASIKKYKIVETNSKALKNRLNIHSLKK